MGSKTKQKKAHIKAEKDNQIKDNYEVKKENNNQPNTSILVS